MTVLCIDVIVEEIIKKVVIAPEDLPFTGNWWVEPMDNWKMFPNINTDIPVNVKTNIPCAIGVLCENRGNVKLDAHTEFTLIAPNGSETILPMLYEYDVVDILPTHGWISYCSGYNHVLDGLHSIKVKVQYNGEETVKTLPNVFNATSGFSVSLNSGWNYISCPLKDERTVGEIFGDKIRYPLYHYWGGYQLKQSGNTLIEGAGIMVNAPSATTVTFLGEPINTAIYLPGGPLLVGYPYLYEKPVSEYSAVYTNFNPKYHCLGEHTGGEAGVKIRFLSGYRDNKYQQIADCGTFTYTHETLASVYGFIDGSITAFIACAEAKEGVDYAEERDLTVMHCFGACEGNVSTKKQCTIPLETFKPGKAYWVFK